MPIIIRKLTHKQYLLQPNIFLYEIWIFVEQKKKVLSQTQVKCCIDQAKKKG